ncbi:CHAT domain-containing protein [Pseudomonas sp. CFBP 8770]|uniref:CHAT domain-containing protein n=1 Tax=unclassified Pseudomonas TaxID=196821 RepID=UPI00177C5BE0|nr:MULTISPECIES: CHAT domain-containing protein [unclassified Pseudomonas]MBD8472915.1 CHAT domain-containing protein [Pseudomonas sp. CFBP 8773]MBD8645982.1 CHAT domain-containing protein [Pseudomonas sp. CFBP 8770]
MSHLVTVEICDSGASLGVRLLTGHGLHDPDQMLRFASMPAQRLPLSMSLSTLGDAAGHGRALLDALNAHGPIALELAGLFSQYQIATTLTFYMTTSTAALYRWEALYNPVSNRFLSAQNNCSMFRIASGRSPVLSESREYSGTITFSAYLSASGIYAFDECKALIEAVKTIRQSGLNIRTYLYVGEQQLLDTAASLLNGTQAIELRPIPANALAFEASLKADRAQLLHFLAHGDIREGEAFLEFASISDHDRNADPDHPDIAPGSIRLSLDRLEQSLAATGTTWFTLLNCCSGAASVSKLSSMAATLAKSVSPITIGMADPIDYRDAKLFAESFYESALKTIHQATASLTPGQSIIIDLSVAVKAARVVLYDTACASRNLPNGFARWCLPIVYLRDIPLKITQIDEKTKTRIDAIAKVLQGFSSDTPPQVRSDVLGLLANEPSIPAQLWPDLNGNI